MSDAPQGWHPDPFGRHEWRYFSAGSATYLVRDGYIEGSDPVEDIPLQAGPLLATAAPVSAPVMPAPSSMLAAAPASGRHSVPAHSGRMTVLAATAVVLVAAAVVVAVAATRHQRSSTAGPSAVTAAMASSSAASSLAVPEGVVVASATGHFAARFPSAPVQKSVVEAIAGVQATIRVAAVRSPVTEVVEEDISSAVPTDQQLVVLRSAIAVAAATATDGSPTQQSDTTFRGNPARTSTFVTPSGEQVTAIAFFQDARTVYFLLADAGAPIQALSTSFQFESPSSPPVLS